MVYQYDFWDDLPDKVKTDIDDAIKQADEGKLLSHEEVMRNIQLLILSMGQKGK